MLWNTPIPAVSALPEWLYPRKSDTLERPHPGGVSTTAAAVPRER